MAFKRFGAPQPGFVKKNIWNQKVNSSSFAPHTAPSVLVSPTPQPPSSQEASLKSLKRNVISQPNLEQISECIFKIFQKHNVLQMSDADLRNIVGIFVDIDSRKELVLWCQEQMMLDTVETSDVIFLVQQYKMARQGIQGTSLTSSAFEANAPQPLNATGSAGEGSGGNVKGIAVTVTSDVNVEEVFPDLKTAVPAGAKLLSSEVSKKRSLLPELPDQQKTSSTSGLKKKGKRKAQKTDLSLKNIDDAVDNLKQGYCFCGCFATQHAFVTNCSNCGRAYCSQEIPINVIKLVNSLGIDVIANLNKCTENSNYFSIADKVDGFCIRDFMTCYECKLNIFYNELERRRLGKFGQSEKLKEFEEGYKTALAKRDQLLKFAKESVKRTTVTDDQTGGLVYGFASDTVAHKIWMSEQELEEDDEAERKERINALEGKVGRMGDKYKTKLDLMNQCFTVVADKSDTDMAQRERKKKITSIAVDDEYEKHGFNEDANYALSASAFRKMFYENEETFEGEDSFSNSSYSGDANEERIGNDNVMTTTEREARIVPLPTLFQRFWYDPNGKRRPKDYGSGLTATNRILSTSEDDQSSGGGSIGFLTAPRTVEIMLDEKHKEDAHAGVAELLADLGNSSISGIERVQNNYYAEDEKIWAEENKQVIERLSRQIESDHHKWALERAKQQKQEISEEGSVMGFQSSLPSQSNTTKTNEDMMAENEVAKGSDQQLHRTADLSFIDERNCLSLHQPWASLMVAGILTHESRSWPLPGGIRGRLWIHASAAELYEEDIKECEEKFLPFLKRMNDENRQKDGAEKYAFPKSYPTKVLLGYVDVLDCLTLEKYHEKFPEEVDRQNKGTPNYIFLCDGTKARMLPLPLGMDGKHKVYKLVKRIWNAARRQLGEL